MRARSLVFGGRLAVVVNTVAHVVGLLQCIHARLVATLVALVVGESALDGLLVLEAHDLLALCDLQQVVELAAGLLGRGKVAPDAVDVRQLGLLVSAQHLTEAHGVALLIRGRGLPDVSLQGERPWQAILRHRHLLGALTRRRYGSVSVLSIVLAKVVHVFVGSRQVLQVCLTGGDPLVLPLQLLGQTVH